MQKVVAQSREEYQQPSPEEMLLAKPSQLKPMTFDFFLKIVTSQHPNRGKKIPAFIIKVTKRTFDE